MNKEEQMKYFINKKGECTHICEECYFGSYNACYAHRFVYAVENNCYNDFRYDFAKHYMDRKVKFLQRILK